MKVFLNGYCKILRLVGIAERSLGVFLLFTIVISILSQVYCRYILDNPLIWVLEVSVNCFIWGTFLGISYALKLNRHITIHTFKKKLPKASQKVMVLFINISILLVSITLAYHALHVIGVESKTPTISLPITLPKSFFFSVPVFCCGLLMSFTSIYNCLANLYTIKTGTKMEPIYA